MIYERETFGKVMDGEEKPQNIIWKKKTLLAKMPEKNLKAIIASKRSTKKTIYIFFLELIGLACVAEEIFAQEC